VIQRFVFVAVGGGTLMIGRFRGSGSARAYGRWRGKQPKLGARQGAPPLTFHEAGTHTSAELA
jgi:hypothetical protein